LSCSVRRGAAGREASRQPPKAARVARLAVAPNRRREVDARPELPPLGLPHHLVGEVEHEIIDFEADRVEGVAVEDHVEGAGRRRVDHPRDLAAIEDAASAAAEAGRDAAELAAQLAGRKPVSTPQSTATDGQPNAESSADALESMLESPTVQQALGMAERARRLQERAAREAARQAAEQAAANKSQQAQSKQPQGRTPGEPSDMQEPGEPTAEKTDGGAIAGQADVADPLRGLDASRRAAIYKLPPRVRDPLLEGMRQRGPAAYQDVIDTYFRQLGRDIPQ